MNPREIRAFLHRLREACVEDHVVFTAYAIERADEDLEMSREDLIERVLLALDPVDYVRDVPSHHAPHDVLHVFVLWVEGPDMDVYVKIVERARMVVISLHRDDP